MRECDDAIYGVVRCEYSEAPDNPPPPLRWWERLRVRLFGWPVEPIRTRDEASRLADAMLADLAGPPREEQP